MAKIDYKKFIIPTLKTLGLGATGLGISELENKYIYKDPGIHDISRLVGGGSGLLAGGLLNSSNPSYKKIGLGILASYLGPKQLALLATDSVKSLSDVMTKKEKDETKIRNMILDTQKATSETAKNLEGATKYLSDTIRQAFPYAAGLGAILTALYAYNSFKNKKSDNKIEIKIPESKNNRSNKNNMYVEIPANKISDKFYNSLSREILFKDKDEEKKNIEKLLSKAASYDKGFTSDDFYNSFKKSQNKIPNSLNTIDSLYLKSPYKAFKEIERRNPSLSQKDHLKILDQYKNKHTSFLETILGVLSTFVNPDSKIPHTQQAPIDLNSKQ